MHLSTLSDSDLKNWHSLTITTVFTVEPVQGHPEDLSNLILAPNTILQVSRGT